MASNCWVRTLPRQHTAYRNARWIWIKWFPSLSNQLVITNVGTFFPFGNCFLLSKAKVDQYLPTGPTLSQYSFFSVFATTLVAASTIISVINVALRKSINEKYFNIISISRKLSWMTFMTLLTFFIDGACRAIIIFWIIEDTVFSNIIYNKKTTVKNETDYETWGPRSFQFDLEMNIVPICELIKINLQQRNIYTQ